MMNCIQPLGFRGSPFRDAKCKLVEIGHRRLVLGAPQGIWWVPVQDPVLGLMQLSSYILGKRQCVEGLAKEALFAFWGERRAEIDV